MQLAGERAAGTAIYFLLAEGEASHWHRVDFSRDLAFPSRRAIGTVAVAGWTQD